MRESLFIRVCNRKVSVRKFCRTVLWSVIVTAGGVSAGARADDTLRLTVKVAKGACEFILPKEVYLGEAIPADFERNNGTVKILPFEITLMNCDGPSGGLEKAGVIFTGSTPFSDSNIFSDSASSNAGFMFKEGSYSGGLSGFKNAPHTVTPGVPSQQGPVGEKPKDGTVLRYTVGFVKSPDGNPRGGDEVSASVSFQIDYR